MTYFKCSLILSLAFFSCLSQGHPNEEKKIAFPSDLVETYQDEANPNLYYIMPTKLTVSRSRFTGRTSFSWKPLQGDKTAVNLVIGLFTGDDLQLTALKYINSETKQRVKFQAIDIRKASIKITEPAEIVSSQESSSLGGSTFSKFQIKLVLTKDGTEAWKESITNGDSIITTGRMTFEARFTNNAGATLWKEYDLALEIAALPDPTKPRDDTAAIKGLANLEGEKYFWGQFGKCENFVDATTFVAPSEAELQNLSDKMTDDERALFVAGAKKSYEMALSAQKEACQKEIQKIKGESWFKEYRDSQGIDCITKELPKWDSVQALLSGRTDEFILGAKNAYEKFKKDECDKIPSVTSVVFILDGETLKKVVVKFSEPVKKDTLAGNILVYPAGHPEFAFKDIVIDKFEGDVVEFHFNGTITKAQKFDTVLITKEVVTQRGKKLGEPAEKKINYP